MASVSFVLLQFFCRVNERQVMALKVKKKKKNGDAYLSHLISGNQTGTPHAPGMNGTLPAKICLDMCSPEYHRVTHQREESDVLVGSPLQYTRHIQGVMEPLAMVAFGMNGVSLT
jgi:hypothetical protein